MKDALKIEPGSRFEQVYVQLFERMFLDRSEVLHRKIRYSGWVIFKQLNTNIEAELRLAFICTTRFVDVLRLRDDKVILRVLFRTTCGWSEYLLPMVPFSTSPFIIVPSTQIDNLDELIDAMNVDEVRWMTRILLNILTWQMSTFPFISFWWLDRVVTSLLTISTIYTNQISPSNWKNNLNLFLRREQSTINTIFDTLEILIVQMRYKEKWFAQYSPIR